MTATAQLHSTPIDPRIRQPVVGDRVIARRLHGLPGYNGHAGTVTAASTDGYVIDVRFDTYPHGYRPIYPSVYAERFDFVASSELDDNVRVDV